jgi:hypothetical protein
MRIFISAVILAILCATCSFAGIYLSMGSSSPIVPHHFISKKKLNEFIHNRMKTRHLVDYLIKKDLLKDLTYGEYQILKTFAIKNGVYLPPVNDRTEQGPPHYHTDVKKLTPHLYILAGFHPPKNQREEYNILSDKLFTVNKRRLFQKFHPDKPAKTEEQARLNAFWFEVINSGIKVLEHRKERLEKMMERGHTLLEDPILLPRSAHDLLWVEAMKGGKQLTYEALEEAASPVGSAIVSKSEPI